MSGELSSGIHIWIATILINCKMLRNILSLFVVLLSCVDAISSNVIHFADANALECVEGSSAQIVDERVVFTNHLTEDIYSWCRIKSPDEGWGLSDAERLTVSISNNTEHSVDLILYVVEGDGFGYVSSKVEIPSTDRVEVSCNLRDLYPDGTPMLDPSRAAYLELVMVKSDRGSQITIEQITTSGSIEPFVRDAQCLVAPSMRSDCVPAAGQRVKYHLDDQSDIYGVLYLPNDWQSNGVCPMIVEFPGNIFFTPTCYSTGAPEQCTIGYGISRGEGVIWLSLPFVDYSKGDVALSGWGVEDDTVDHTIRIVRDVCEKFGADPNRVVLTGFSRGAIACGYIGLRNDEISQLWCGMHMCQHWDGDGWRGASYDGAQQRILRGANIPQFHTDNDVAELKSLLHEAGIETQFVDSKLGAHSCAMFLDNRESTMQLREWFGSLVE